MKTCVGRWSISKLHIKCQLIAKTYRLKTDKRHKWIKYWQLLSQFIYHLYKQPPVLTSPLQRCDVSCLLITWSRCEISSICERLHVTPPINTLNWFTGCLYKWPSIHRGMVWSRLYLLLNFLFLLLLVDVFLLFQAAISKASTANIRLWSLSLHLTLLQRSIFKRERNQS